MRCRPLLPLLTVLATALAGCRTTPTAATAVAPAAPTSIAYTPTQVAAPGTWTTAPERAPTLRREGAVADPRAPLGLLANPSDPAFESATAGDAVTRGDKGSLATAGPWQLIVSSDLTYVAGGDLEGGGDGPTLWSGNVRLSFEKPLDYFGRLRLGASYTRREYDWSGPNSVIAGTSVPFASVDVLRASANLFQPVHESWALVGSFSVSMAAEEGADLADGFGWSATFGVGHRYSSKLDLGVGILAAKSFGESFFFIGGPQFDWHPTPQWQVALQGTQLDVAYRPNAVWEFGLSGSFQGVRFRLREDGPGAGGIAGDTRLPIYARVRYRGLERLDLEARVGVDVWRYFTLEDRNGHGEYSVEADPAPFFGLRAVLRL